MSVPGNKSLFTGDYWMPHGAITNGTEAVFDVISSPLMPITETEQFRAKLAVTVTRTSGVASGYVYKDFSPKTLYGELPGNTRAITLTESDITGIVPPPPIPQFVPVTDVLISSADIVKGTNTQLSWAVIPGDATNKDGYWTVYLSDSTYSITQGGSVWVSSSRSYDYLYVAHVIPNGIAEGTRNTTLHYVPEVGVAIYDGNKDFFKVFKLNVKTGSSGGTGGTGGGGTSYSTYILKDGGSTKIDKLVFRPTSGTFTDMYSYDGMNNRGLHMNPRSSGPVLANEYSSWTSADEQPGDIVITLTSIKNTGDQQTFDLPAGEYKVIAVQSNGYVKGCTANYWLNFSTESSFWNGKNGFYFRLCADSVAPQSGMSSEKLHLRAWMKP
jgi:hypothetical protein